MKKLFFVALLLFAKPAISQSVFSPKELINIYLSDKEKAIKTIQAKGYSPAGAEDFQALFVPGQDNAFLYSRKQDASKVGFILDDNKIASVVFTDSVKTFNTLPQELKKLNFELANQHGDISRAYVKRKTGYFIIYDVIDDTKSIAVMSVILKTKRNKILYSPKR